MSPHAKHGFSWLPIVLLVLAVVFSVALVPPGRAVGHDPLAAALQRAQAAGSYHFTSDITQMTVPISKVTNVGRSSRTDRFHLEGQTNLRDQSTQMRLWTQQGSVSDPASGIAVKVENGKTYVQEGFGAWHEQEGLTEAFAPHGDFMAFLTALRDPVAHAPEENKGVHYTRYTFRLDGPALARYLRDLTEDLLRRRAELPLGTQLEVPAYYRDMVGDGEVWIDSQGLPLRQILRMRFPEQRDEIVQAEIVTNYSGFGPVASGTAPGRVAKAGAWLSAFLARRADLVPGLLAALVVAAFCTLMLRARTGGWRGLALALIVLLVLNPLLSDRQVAQAASALQARIESQEQQREESRQRDDLLARLAEPNVDPHADPLRADPGTADMPPAAGFRGLGTSQPLTAPPAQVEDGTDTDSDGLTDFQEERVGTDPGYWDTDEDLITDTVEVRGFSLVPGGIEWFMDANGADSNNDGSLDTVEYDFNGDGVADDTDHDLLPDVFDSDNDDDGVPDHKDLAPFSQITTTFTATNPFRLRLNNLSPGVPTFVDIQLRPKNSQHLWFAYQVLDWPAGDTAGHVRDDDGVTFATLPPQPGDLRLGDNDGNGDENGDMKMVPMLEIRVPEYGANLPPQADLTPYNISVNSYSEDGSQLVAYVPVSIITDEQSGAHVAFNARVRYLPTGSWLAAHEVRLVWLLQVLNDIPCDAGAADAPQGCAADNYIHNELSVVQTYGDEWTLTGLNVKEDHGARQAIVYEDPAVDPNPEQDEALTALSAGLDQSFLSGRDQDGNGLRDVDLNEVERRFNHPSNDGVSEVERWGVPDTLRVERQDYATVDRAIMATAMTETLRILNEGFTAPWIANSNIKPLLLYAQEAWSRALGMDAMIRSEGWVTWDGSAMVVDLHPAGQAAAPLVMTANLKWTPYCAPPAATPEWSPCEMDTWWETLDARYPGVLPGDPDDPLIVAGRAMALNLYESVLMQGVSRVVEQAQQNLTPSNQLKSDSALKAWFELGNTGVTYVANEVLMLRYQPGSTYNLLRDLGEKYTSVRNGVNWLLTKAGGWLGLLEPGATVSRGMTTGVVVAAGLVVGWLAFDYFQGGLAGKIALSSFTIALQTYSGVIAPLVSVKEHIRGLSRINQIVKLGGLESEVVGNSKLAGVIGAVFGAAITWGFYIYNMVASRTSAFSPEFNSALAETIAQTIYLIMLLVLSATVIGGIIAAIAEVIDLILSAICELGADELRDVPGLGGACFTVGGLIVKGLTWGLYNFAPMVDTERKDLLVLGSPQLQLADPSQGLVAGNPLSITMPVTTTVVHRNPRLADGPLIFPYGWLFYTKSNLRSSTFKYSLTTVPEDVAAQRNEMSGAWQVSEDHQWGAIAMYRGQTYTVVDSGAIDVAAGVNRELAPYFNLGYSVPAYECWLTWWWFIPVPVCYVRSLAGNDSQPMERLLLDVFPATLDDFMSLSGSGEGRKQAWDAKFRILNDADGDGLIAISQDGPDPDDGRWDTDGDGLSDTFELERRQEAGAAYSPTAWDTDGDGLTDQQEAQLGTAPGRADTDLDGLTDSQEVVHPVYVHDDVLHVCVWDGSVGGGWWVEMPFGDIRVESDPLLPDTDGDGVSDLNERDWGGIPDPEGRPYHPTVPNVPLLSVTAKVSRDRLAPGASLAYTTTLVASTALSPTSYLDVSLPPALGGDVRHASLAFDPATFTETQTVSSFELLNVLESATTQLATITSTAVGVRPTDTLTVTATTPIRIDADPPTSRIDSLSDGRYVRGDASMPVIVIIGGSADDNLTGIERVEVSVNDGPWQAAYGTTTWTFQLNAGGAGLSSTDGTLNVRTRTTDGAGNVETPGPGVEVRVDGRPPDFNFQNQPAQPVVPRREADGHWAVPLGGMISDPTIGSSGDPGGIDPGSGIDPASLQVRLHSTGRATKVVGDWQPVTLVENQWSTVYTFTVDVADPTGAWVAEMRAADMVGNTRQEKKAAPDLYLDSAAPTANLSPQDLDRAVLTGTASIGGVISDTVAGVDRLEVSFAPLEQVAPSSDAVLWLSFDESDNAAYWADRSGQGNDANCTRSWMETCPATSPAGRLGGGLAFPGGAYNGYTSVHNADALNFAAGAGFSVQAWVKPDGDGGIMRNHEAYELSVYDTQAEWILHKPGAPWYDYWSVSGGPDIIDGVWHYIVGTFGPREGEVPGSMRLFVDGALVGEQAVPTDPDYRASGPFELGLSSHGYFAGMMDEVVVFRHALSPVEVQALYQAANRPWYPANLAQRGSGVTQTAWSAAVPAGLEGTYQIDLRGHDVLGNTRVSANAWRGTIDTWAPRFSLTAEGTGAIYIDPATQQSRVGVRYGCGAFDAYLDDSSFQCPGSNLPPPTRSFDQDPILHGLFPDLTLRNGLVISWTQWQPPGAFSPTVGACDVFGNCATDTRQFAVVYVPVAGPTAAVVAPADRAVIGSMDGTVSVTVAANAPNSLRSVTLSLDGAIVNRVDFDQGNAVVFDQRMAAVTASEGPHTLIALASDWAGNAQVSGFPVQFTLDTHPPALTISTTPISQTAVYHKGSPMLRFSGTASDTLCLAAVQLRVGDGPFVDATFGDGTWSAAYYVNAPEGQTLTVTVRAIDCAGQISQITRGIDTDLSAPDAPETQMISTPGNPSLPDGATFTFQALKGGQEVAGLLCRLDGATYTPCSSPNAYERLSEGQHTFYVRAIDVEGNVDETPANFTWMVRATINYDLWLPFIAR